MKPETLFDNFEVLAEAPNGIMKLREMILQLAVRGKLVAQDETDEPAIELLKRIRKKKGIQSPNKQKIEGPQTSNQQDGIPYNHSFINHN